MSAPDHPVVLLIDDDRRLTSMVAEILDTEGYASVCAMNGTRGLLLLEEHMPDLVVLDVMMSGKDGIETLAELRQRTNVPVIMLTALGDQEHRIRGLEAGADDYVSKPFAARELLLRMRAVLKRTGEHEPGSADIGCCTAGPIEVRLSSQKATISGVKLPLTSTELRILAVLVDRAGAVVTRQFLGRYALGREVLPEDRTVDMHLSNLRRKIASVGKSACEIRNVRGCGYRLIVS